MTTLMQQSCLDSGLWAASALVHIELEKQQRFNSYRGVI
jgi:hypothetical protein